MIVCAMQRPMPIPSCFVVKNGSNSLSSRSEGMPDPVSRIETSACPSDAHDVRLDSNLAQQPLRVKGDKVQLQQVVLNLIVNGIDAIRETPNGVREIACRSWASDGHALVSIRDTGPGIPSDRLERLFEPFFTTKQDGMGMGLCIAHTIMEAHSGKISAESRPSGAVFHVSLPLAKAHG
jgi:C4-dicarboxylate-specific signal transduction histidine kinase